jgi:UDP-N-acetylglucosamine transferase subunit ALG13
MQLPLVFVTVGTDHHPFDRLIEWIDGWFADGGGRRARCLVQSGASKPPAHAPWRPYLSAQEMETAMSEAACIVCHGGPTTIIDAGRHGRTPLVVPRLKSLGEHVDDHQVAFVRWIGAQQAIVVVDDEGRLRALIDRAVADPDAFRTTSTPVETERAVQLIESWIDDLVSRPRRRSRGPG